MDIRILRTVLVCASIVSAILLWFTRSEWLNSLSAFALSDNVVYYRVMHLTAVLFFALGERKNLILAFGMASILAFDMYHFPTIHNIVTAFTLGYACFDLIRTNKGFERTIMIFLSFSAVLFFCIGYFVDSFHHLLAEIIAMVCVMNGKLRETWVKELKN